MSLESSQNQLRKTLVKLHALWDARKYQTINEDLTKFFKHSDDIVLDCLDLIEFSKDKRKPDSLGSRIIDKFNVFRISNPSVCVPISEEIKERVLDIATVSHSKLAARLISTFEVDKPSLDLVRHHIKNLCKNGNLNAAISLATALNLQNELSIYEIAVPIFMQTKLGLLDDYMQGSEKVQLEMINLLNHWLSDDFNMISFCSEHGIRSMREEILRPQFHEKMLTKWLKIYGKENQAAELCPNLCRRRSLGAVKYLLYRYYIEESATFENAVELIKKTVGNNEWLQHKLIDILEHSYNDHEAVDVFKKIFNMTQSHLQSIESFEGDDWGSTENWGGESSRMNTIGTTLETSKPSAKSVCKSKKENFHSLRLPDDSVTMVSDAETLTNCIDAVLEQSDVVGIDAEWLFTRNLSDAHDIALLQLATNSNVYLLDMISVSSDPSLQEMVAEFLKKLFFSQQHIKVGFGLREDLRKISSSLSGIENLSKQSCRVIDLNVVNKHVQRLYPQIFSVPEPATISKQVSGLSKMLLQTIGAKLDKSEQISDWERRPLRKAQIKYAALDAYCLIEIYDVLTARLKEIDANFSLETILLQKPSTARVGSFNAMGRGRGRGRSLQLNKQSSFNQKKLPVKVADFRVVCDNMLQGLGRQLRCCGVDTLILSNFDSHDKAAHLARKEKRIILTSGAPFMTLSSQVPIGNCLDMPNDLKAKEQLKLVLEYYNVQVRMCDIFSRCQICNCGKYLKVLPTTMLQLYSVQANACRAVEVPWEQFRKDIDLSEKKYTVVCSSDDESDDDFLVVDGFDKPKTTVESVANSTSPPKLQESSTKNNRSLKQTTPVVPSPPSSGCTSYHINPDSLSNSSTLNLQTGEIVTVNPDSGEKCCTSLLYKQVPKPVCNQVTEFFCCIKCGKVYWEGHHFGNVLTKFGDIISK